MINNLNNVMKKSFNNYTSTVSLADINIFFGTNGSGKSALSEWIFEQDILNSRKFDTKYVLENLKAENSNSVKGVKLTVGRKAIDNKENIERIESTNVSLEADNQRIISSVSSLKQELVTILETSLNNARTRFRTTKIRQKPNAQIDPEKAVLSWIADINQNLNSSTTSSTADIENAINSDKTMKTAFQNINDHITEERFKKLIQYMTTETIVPNENISSNLVNWLSEGLKHHHLDENAQTDFSLETECKFCGENFNSVNIKRTIDEKINSEHTILLKALEKFQDSFKNVKIKIINLPKDFEKDKKTILISEIDTIFQNLQDKIVNTNQVFRVNNNFYSLLSEFDELITNRIDEIQKVIVKNEQLIQTIEDVAKSWVGVQLKNNNRIPEILTALEDLENSLNQNNVAINENKDWIADMQKINSKLTPFVKLVNTHFKYLGLEFELEISSNNQQSYDLKHTNANATPLRVEDLSEGERRLLAFLHFYFDLFENYDNKTLVANITTIIIDDPITSLDANNRYHLTKLITDFIHMMNDGAVQLFIFTHSSMDFQNFSYKVKNKQNVKLWKVTKDELSESKVSVATGSDLKNISDHYQSIFMEVLDFSLLNREKIQLITYDCYKYANQARTLIESHARSHYKIGLATNNEEDELIRVYNIPKDKQDDFKRALAVINISSHGTSLLDTPVNGYDPKEIQSAIRTIVATLYRKDKYHVESMSPQDEPLSSSKKRQIQNWT